MSEALAEARGMNRKGPVISFSGMDGSGKTTLALVAAGELRNQGYPVRILRLYPYSPKTILEWVFKTLSPSYRPAPRKSPAGMILGTIMGLFARGQFLLDCFILRHMLRYYTDRGVAVVCDRYPYDSIVKIYHNGLCSESSCRKLAKFIPRPDAAFMLRYRKDILASRAGYSTESDYDAASGAYLKFHDLDDFWTVDTDDGRKARTEVRGILTYEGRRW